MTDPYAAQRAVLGTLLDSHPALLEVDELVDRLDEVPRAREALRVLVDDGVAVRLGDASACRARRRASTHFAMAHEPRSDRADELALMPAHANRAVVCRA